MINERECTGNIWSDTLSDRSKIWSLNGLYFSINMKSRTNEADLIFACHLFTTYLLQIYLGLYHHYYCNQCYYEYL